MSNLLLSYIEEQTGQYAVFPFHLRKGNNTIPLGGEVLPLSEEEADLYYEDKLRWLGYAEKVNDRDLPFQEVPGREGSYFPITLSNTDITPELYDDLLELIDAEDVSSVGREHSIYVLKGEVLNDIINGVMLRFSDVDTRLMVWVEAIYQVLDEGGRERLAEMVNEGDRYLLKDVQQLLSLREEQMREVVYLILRGLGFPDSPVTVLKEAVLPLDIRSKMVDRDRMYRYLPILLGMLRFNTLESGMLADILRVSPFAEVVREVKSILSLERIESREDETGEAMLSYLSYAVAEQGMIPSLDRQIPGFDSSDRANILNGLRSALPVSLVEDDDSHRLNLLRYYYYGMLNKDTTDMDALLFGLCQ